MAKTFSRLAVIAGLGVAFAGCTPLDNAIASVPYLAMMRNSPFFDPYEAPMPAPPGSIPFESPAGVHMPPLEGNATALTAFAATPAGQNPFRHEDAAALANGQKMFERYCAVCHNKDGKGNGPIVGPDKFPMGPNLTIEPALSLPDGYIYGIIRAGRGNMPAYGSRVNHYERWAIATYVKHLQAGGSPAAAPAQAPAAAAPAAQENR